MRFAKTLRRERAELLLFLRALTLVVESGLDLFPAWTQVLQRMRPGLPQIAAYLEPHAEKSFGVFLSGVGDRLSNPTHRLWFPLLSELYQSGAPLNQTLLALTDSLCEEQEKDWKNHTQTLPVKVSLILALFFVLPALALVLLPLLWAISASFS